MLLLLGGRGDERRRGGRHTQLLLSRSPSSPSELVNMNNNSQKGDAAERFVVRTAIGAFTDPWSRWTVVHLKRGGGRVRAALCPPNQQILLVY